MELPSEEHELRALLQGSTDFLIETAVPIEVVRFDLGGREPRSNPGRYSDYGAACAACSGGKRASTTLVTFKAIELFGKLAHHLAVSLSTSGSPKVDFQRVISTSRANGSSSWLEHWHLETGDPALPILSLHVVSRRELATARAAVVELRDGIAKRLGPKANATGARETTTARPDPSGPLASVPPSEIRLRFDLANSTVVVAIGRKKHAVPITRARQKFFGRVAEQMKELLRRRLEEAGENPSARDSILSRIEREGLDPMTLTIEASSSTAASLREWWNATIGPGDALPPNGHGRYWIGWRIGVDSVRD